MFQNPLTHTRRTNSWNIAVCHLGHDFFNLDQLLGRVPHRSTAQLDIDQHAPVVDALVPVVVVQLLG